jgi:hypothetical protein
MLAHLPDRWGRDRQTGVVATPAPHPPLDNVSDFLLSS